MTAHERKLLRKQINLKLKYMANKESKENDFYVSPQIITERQQMYMTISHHFRTQDNRRRQKNLPFNVEKNALPHVNLSLLNRIYETTDETMKSPELNKVLNAHSFRTATPFYTNPALTIDRGKVMNYSAHVGTILHTPRYIEFLKTSPDYASTVKNQQPTGSEKRRQYSASELSDSDSTILSIDSSYTTSSSQSKHSTIKSQTSSSDSNTIKSRATLTPSKEKTSVSSRLSSANLFREKEEKETDYGNGSVSLKLSSASLFREKREEEIAHQSTSVSSKVSSTKLFENENEQEAHKEEAELASQRSNNEHIDKDGEQRNWSSSSKSEHDRIENDDKTRKTAISLGNEQGHVGHSDSRMKRSTQSKHEHEEMDSNDKTRKTSISLRNEQEHVGNSDSRRTRSTQSKHEHEEMESNDKTRKSSLSLRNDQEHIDNNDKRRNSSLVKPLGTSPTSSKDRQQSPTLKLQKLNREDEASEDDFYSRSDSKCSLHSNENDASKIESQSTPALIEIRSPGRTKRKDRPLAIYDGIDSNENDEKPLDEQDLAKPSTSSLKHSEHPKGKSRQGSLIPDCEAFFRDRQLELEDLDLIKRYFETVEKYRESNSSYVVEFGTFLSKNNREDFSAFQKILADHGIENIDDGDSRSISDMISTYQLKGSPSEARPDSVQLFKAVNDANKSESKPGEAEENVDNRLLESRDGGTSEDIQNNVSSKHINETADVKIETERGAEGEDENSDDFADAFQRLFRNSIAIMNKEDMMNLKKLINEYDIEKEVDIQRTEKDSDFFAKFEDLFMSNKESMSTNDFANLLQVLNRESDVNFSDQNQIFSSLFEDYKETISDLDVEKVKGLVSKEERNGERRLSQNGVDDEEDNETMLAFRNLFRSSVGELKKTDLEEIQRIITEHV